MRRTRGRASTLLLGCVLGLTAPWPLGCSNDDGAEELLAGGEPPAETTDAHAAPAAGGEPLASAGAGSAPALPDVERSIVDAVDGLVDSVVSIEVQVPVQSSVVQLHGDWPFADPFADPLLDPFDLLRPDSEQRRQRRLPATEQPERLQRSGGSGVIHDAEGHIVTNNHVVEDARTIRVSLRDGRVFDAEVVGLDPESDLAVIRIDADGLVPARYADVSAVRPGQFAIAVGMPFNLDYSVTVGHVSALGRAGLSPSSSSPMQGRDRSSFLSIQHFIQTDTVINPGNSGGPLVDLQGAVMGINSIVHGGIGGGFGFAIPADIVQDVAGQLIADGAVSRAWVGLSMSDLSYETSRAFGLDRTRGALVEEVADDGPADRAGVQRGDVILEVDGRAVDDASDVVYRVASRRAGEQVTLTLMRDGARRSVDVTAGDRGDGLAAATAGGVEDERDTPDPENYGMALEALDGALNRRLGRAADAGGVLVRAVRPGGVAARAGIAAGDVIVDVAGRPVGTPQDVLDAVARVDREYVALTVERDGRRRFVVIERLDGPPAFSDPPLPLAPRGR